MLNFQGRNPEDPDAENRAGIQDENKFPNWA